ncbi:MAG TPA: multicopper oxidase domain-containing protein [Acidimicrobiales bacterium]|nr:multicopper oxidase domain-containing protein [Acidimicrobiales bacterium]
MQQQTKRDDAFVLAIFVSVLAVLIAVIGVGLGMRAIDESEGRGGAAGAEGGQLVEVELADFRLTPASATAATDGAVEVTNGGAVVHDLTVEGTEATTGPLDPGASGRLELAGLEPGTYTMFCSIPGHKDAGMSGALTIAAAGGEGASGAAATDSHGGTAGEEMTADEMDAVMHDVTASFPAKTKGVGGQLLEPTVLPDGTKQFDLTAEIVDWEVEAGKTVEAWTYNGTVPGPTIKVADGDRIRVVLENKLPESTAIHFHGLHTPNAMDGVPDITQEPIKPGATFTYEFVAKGPAVGMYHSHHNAHKQVPNGLAATILVGDLPLPPGVTLATEYEMMLNDAGTIGFSLNGKSFPATAPLAVKQGDWVLVHYLNEGIQPHPMHLHGLDQLVIAKDGFPVPQPYKADTINVAPGERWSVLVQANEPGVWAWHCHILPHAERSTGMFGMVTAMIVQ